VRGFFCILMPLMSPSITEAYPPEWRNEAAHALACSDFVAESLARDSELFVDLLRSDALQRLRIAGGSLCWPGG